MGFLARWSASRSRAAARAAAEERQRIAREIHDGLAQELAFISLNVRRLAHESPDGTLDEIAGAAERALKESRELITDLRLPGRELGDEISQTAAVLAKRHGASLNLDVDPDFRADPETGRNILRIVAEALSNGLVHGRARTVTVQLSGGDGRRLRVADDGIGFEPGASRRRDHFGLTSMRERAHDIGGDLLVRSKPGRGTEVEVVLP